MSDDMKRVGLIFKEDGSADFTKSLNLVNASLRENYQNFKLVQAQWDSSTTSTQKLKDKLEYLNKAYNTQEDKVITLKKQIEELESAENKNELAIQKKKAALAQAETGLQKYKNQIDETSNKLKNGSERIEEYAKKMNNAGDKIEKAGKKMSAFSLASSAALLASSGSAIEFESAFAGVEKTVDATDEQLEKMKQQIRQMAKEIPASTTEISKVAEAAGQLGIKTEDIISFTKVMINLGNSTNLSSEEAASSLAKFANVTKMSANDYDKLGSVIVALGNNFATTEKDIVEMATKLAATGELTGLSQAQIMALATSMSSVGIEAEAGGSAMSKLLKNIQLATELGGENLNQFASVADMTAEQFKQAFEKDAVSALSAFLKGLNDTEKNGKSAIVILDEMGLTETRLSNTILSLSNASDVMNDAVEISNKSWEENNALTKESSKRYETLKSKLQISLQKIIDMGITLGNKLMPKIENIISVVGKWIDKFGELNDEQISTIINVGLVIAALGPAITIIGKTTTTISGTVKAFGAFKEAINVAMGTVTSAKSNVNGLASVFKAITSPIGIACTAIIGSIGLIALAINESNKVAKENFQAMGNSATEFVTGIDNATSHLNSFNNEMFASSQEQQELQANMDQIQKGITAICKNASNERRNYTQEEVVQLDEYFAKLRDLKNKELEIQKQIASAIKQQAVTTAETHKGTLEEYKVMSQEWIKTAQEQATNQISIINNSSIEEIALLNTRYGTEANMQNEAYANEYNKIIEQKQQKIDAANQEVSEVNMAYTNGYTQRAQNTDSFIQTAAEANIKIEEEKIRHGNKVEELEKSFYFSEVQRQQDIQKENTMHMLAQKSIWDNMYKNMDKNQADQLGAWLGMISQTELYGGKIDDETQKVVNGIISSYDSMPKETQEAMKNAMTPMFNEMQNSEPNLFAKATGIANGILNRLQKAFDIHSPSKKTRAIFKNVMLGAEKGLEEEEKNLYNQADSIAKNVLDNLKRENDYNINSKIVGNGSYATTSINIDYEKLSNSFLKALNSCKLKLDDDGFIKLVDNRLLEVL